MTFAALSLASIFLGGCERSAEKVDKNEQQKVTAPTAPELILPAKDVFSVSTTTLESQQTATGTLKAGRSVVIRSRTSGELQEIVAREGKAVKSGQVIVKIDDQDHRLRLNERLAARQSAKAQLELAQRNFNNQKQLFEKGFISQAALDGSSAQLEVSRANLDSAQAAVRLAERSLGDTRLKAPISGVVGEWFVQPGEKVSPDTRLVSIIDLNSLELEVPVSAEQVSRLAVGQKAQAVVEGTGVEIPGVITRINAQTAPGTRSIPVIVKLSQTPATLRVGMFAQAKFTTQRLENVVAIPQAAVREIAGKRFVYVLNADHSVTEQIVETGIQSSSENGTMVEVRNGLKSGQRIIATNLGLVKPGTKIQISPGKG